MSGSFESVQWNVCVHRLDYTLIRKSFKGMKSEPLLTPMEKSPTSEKKSPQRRIEPSTLHQAGQRVQHTNNELFRLLTFHLISQIEKQYKVLPIKNCTKCRLAQMDFVKQYGAESGKLVSASISEQFRPNFICVYHF